MNCRMNEEMGANKDVWTANVAMNDWWGEFVKVSKTLCNVQANAKFVGE